MNSLAHVQMDDSYVVSYAVVPQHLKHRIQPQFAPIVMAIVEIAAAAKEQSDKQDFKNWQSSVSSKLDFIIAALDEIRKELAALKTWIDERITEETRRQYSTRIGSLSTEINTILCAFGSQGNQPKKAQLDDLADYFRDLRVTIGNLLDTDGYSHVMSVIVGTLTCLPLFHLLGRETELPIWGARINKYLSDATDPNIPTSLEAARNFQANDFIAKQGDLSSLLNRPWVTNYRPGVYDDGGPSGGQGTTLVHRPSRPPGYVAQTAGINEVGQILLLGRVAGDYSESNGGYPWYPYLGKQFTAADGPDASWAAMWSDLTGRSNATSLAASSQSSLLNQIQLVLGVKEKLAAKP